MTEIDLDLYREYNDIGGEDPAPRQPRGDPDVVNDDFRAWLFDADESETVPDVYVVDRNPDPLDFRMWVFVGRGEHAAFAMRASHRYGKDELPPEGREDCCEVLMAGRSLATRHCPELVREFVAELTGASVVSPDGPDGDRSGSINYR